MTLDLLLQVINDKIVELDTEEWPRICDTDKIIILRQVLEEYEKLKREPLD